MNELRSITARSIAEGSIYWQLTVVRAAGKTSGGYRYLCKCDCGRETVVYGKFLIAGTTKSCGCRRSKSARITHSRHGNARDGEKSPTYITWLNMRQRCNNPRHTAWPDYGGRGITVCARWDIFENFLADMGERPEGTSIERIDNARGYGPDNCRWATRTEQNRNRRSSHNLTYNGQERTVAEWSEVTGIPYRTIMSRLTYGWSTARIFGGIEL